MARAMVIAIVATAIVPAMVAIATVPGTGVATVTAGAIVIAARMDVTGIVTRTADAIVNASRAAARAASMVATGALRSRRVMRNAMRHAKRSGTNRRASVIRNARPNDRHSVSANANVSVNSRLPPIRTPIPLPSRLLATALWPRPAMRLLRSKQAMAQRRTVALVAKAVADVDADVDAVAVVATAIADSRTTTSGASRIQARTSQVRVKPPTRSASFMPR